MDRFRNKLPDSLMRLLVVIAALTALGVFVVLVLIPRPMKDVRLQWAADIARERAIPVRYAGFGVCMECHDEIDARKGKGHHRDVSCETCHGPARAHADDPERARPAIPETRGFCPRCHAFDPSRPKGFPMIHPEAHNPLQPCAACHDPHHPEPPVPPKDCSACHGEISRAKAVSPHARLDCTTCHETPPLHMATPRVVRPSKPQEREFCGRCHAEGAGGEFAAVAPKVDMARHGGKYVCWQCHFPHSPEVAL